VAKLVGRDADLKLLEGLLNTRRCVTLVGPVGRGQDQPRARRRGALAGAQRSGPIYRRRRTQARLQAAIARALGVHLTDGEPEPQLLRALKGNAVLLVLDNAEAPGRSLRPTRDVLHATAEVQLSRHKPAAAVSGQRNRTAAGTARAHGPPPHRCPKTWATAHWRCWSRASSPPTIASE